MNTYILKQNQMDDLRRIIAMLSTTNILRARELDSILDGAIEAPPLVEPTPGSATISALNLTDDEAASILTTAIEGGSDYWANDGYVCSYNRRNESPGLVYRFCIRQERGHEDEVESPLSTLPTEDRKTRDRVTGEPRGTVTYAVIDLAAIKAAADAIVRNPKELDLAPRYAGYLASERDACDAETADAVLQVACFGKVIYG